jgi:Secretion system C-terminal sorting domain
MKKLFFLILMSNRIVSFAQSTPAESSVTPTGGCEGVDYLGIYSINTLDGNPVFALFNNIKYSAKIVLSPAMNTCEGNLSVSLMQSNKLIQVLAQQRAITGVFTTVQFPPLNVAPGRYDLVMTYDAYMLRSATTAISVIDITAVSNVSSESSISIFPIPANDVLTIYGANFEEPINEVRLTDMTGRQVKSEHSTHGNSALNIFVGDLPTGIYMLQLQTKTEILNKTITIRH